MPVATLPDLVFPYDIIYADPPWSYRGKEGSGQNVADVYPTMTTDDIKGLAVKDISADDSLLFMWATGPNLPDALDVGKAWGFKYATVAFVWEKKITNSGNYTLPSTEMVLVFKRGKIPQPRGARNIRQFLSSKRGRHSAKPEMIMHRIEAMFPTQRKIELFARRGVDGWDGWGNELAKSMRETLI